MDVVGEGAKKKSIIKYDTPNLLNKSVKWNKPNFKEKVSSELRLNSVIESSYDAQKNYKKRDNSTIEITKNPKISYDPVGPDTSITAESLMDACNEYTHDQQTLIPTCSNWDIFRVITGHYSPFTVTIVNLADVPLPTPCICELKLCTQIRWVSIVACSIDDISVFNNIYSLEVLNVSKNKIQTLNTLQGLPLLQVLTLNGNPISSTSDFSGLSGLSSLRRLDLCASDGSDMCPVCTLPAYEKIIFAYLPKLSTTPCTPKSLYTTRSFLKQDSDLDTPKSTHICTPRNDSPITSAKGAHIHSTRLLFLNGVSVEDFSRLNKCEQVYIDLKQLTEISENAERTIKAAEHALENFVKNPIKDLFKPQQQAQVYDIGKNKALNDLIDSFHEEKNGITTVPSEISRYVSGMYGNEFQVFTNDGDANPPYDLKLKNLGSVYKLITECMDNTLMRAQSNLQHVKNLQKETEYLCNDSSTCMDTLQDTLKALQAKI